MSKPATRSLGWCLALLALTAAAPPAPVVATRAGKVEGVGRDGIHGYLGIPFAAPPVGPNRWRAPQPPQPWTGVRPAGQFGPSCWQAVSPQGFGPWTHEYVVQDNVSEDCLYLNIWAPAPAKRKLPVLVWIHGGGFNSGSGALPLYHGHHLARRGIVVVTINYRVNVFGFLAHPELSREPGAPSPSNFGLQDMIAALRWVKANIAGFGGDPGAVTIAGQSAGAMAVHELIASPSAHGLFHRAIAQSGVAGRRTAPALADAEKDGLAFAAEKGSTSLAALRAIPAEKLQASQGGNAIRFMPVVDGKLLPLPPAEAVRMGRFADVPILAGFTADENSALSDDYGSTDPAVLKRQIGDVYGSLAERAASFYPAASEADRSRSNVELYRDRWRANLYIWAGNRVTARQKLYAYMFNRTPPGPAAEKWRAFHSAELPYLFGTFEAAPERGFTAEDRAFSDRVTGYWVNFVKTGNPNGAGLPSWPAWQEERPAIMELSDPIVAKPLLSPEKLEALRAHLASQR